LPKAKESGTAGTQAVDVTVGAKNPREQLAQAPLPERNCRATRQVPSVESVFELVDVCEDVVARGVLDSNPVGATVEADEVAVAVAAVLVDTLLDASGPVEAMLVEACVVTVVVVVVVVVLCGRAHTRTSSRTGPQGEASTLVKNNGVLLSVAEKSMVLYTQPMSA
jgi:hypothetical protein